MYRFVLTAVLATAIAGSAWGAPKRTGDWPSWRGPNHDGISKDQNWDPQKLNGKPKTLWTKQLGKGWSVVTVKGKYLFTMGNKGNKDFVYCLNAVTGEEIWKQSYDCPAGNSPGPRGTPVISGNNLYTMSRKGHAICWEARTGKKVWEKNLMREFGARDLKWGLTASPRIYDGMVIYNAGKSGIALDAKTGKKIWSSSGVGGYAVPVIYEYKGKPCVAIFSQKSIVGVDAKTGNELWSYPWVTAHDVNAADPIVDGSYVFFGSGYGKGSTVVKLGNGNPKKVWQNKKLAAHFSTPVLVDGHLYGISGNAGRGTLQCIEMKTGREKWSEKTGFGALMVANDKLIIQNDRGQIMVAKVSSSGYKEIAKCQAFRPRGKAWSMPVLANGILYLRDSSGQMVALDARK